MPCIRSTASKFDGNVGQVVLLNTVEEWKIVNRTVNGGGPERRCVVTTDPPGVVDHPFHIHINPFQITEVFDPNEVLPGHSDAQATSSTGAAVRRGQCLLDLAEPGDLEAVRQRVRRPTASGGTCSRSRRRAPCSPGPGPNTQVTVVPGYFKMRSRFVDFTGQYVIHCHILAHEDRGMMTIVQVVPFTTAYSHK